METNIKGRYLSLSRSFAIKTSILAHIRLSRTLRKRGGEGGEGERRLEVRLVCIHRCLRSFPVYGNTPGFPHPPRPFAGRNRRKRRRTWKDIAPKEAMAEKFNGPESCMSRGCSFERVMHVLRAIVLYT